MMYFLIIAIFILGYVAIAFEHQLKINKSAIAILTGVLCWTVFILANQHQNVISEKLIDHLGDISNILFFLMGAMTIVELIDAHEGFEVITNVIKTDDKRKLLWIISLLTFFLSSALDNLTTSIVMVTLLRKLIKDKEDRMYFVGMVVIAANAGGAWSPIGDVTTTMLWIGHQISSANIMVKLFIPSIICVVAPVLLLSFKIKGKAERPSAEENRRTNSTTRFERNLIFGSGIGALIFVPIFKEFTQLPPFMGMMFGLGILWIITEIIHKSKNDEIRGDFTVVSALQRIDVPSVLFFLGILIAIAALQSAGQLADLAHFMDKDIGSPTIIVIAIGLLSAIIDNVPLTAAAMGMYALTRYPTDNYFWEFLAFCAGTGGSVLIIGSAAGVAVMGMEKINFMWYMKRVSLLALIGYFAGALTYMGLEVLFYHY